MRLLALLSLTVSAAACAAIQDAGQSPVSTTAAIPLPDVTPAGETPGAVTGSLQVSGTGAATYSVPIAVPPGAAGMVPALSLVYSSHAGNGLLGHGFTLAGVSAITRCPSTLAQDGVAGAVDLTTGDRFCLDGQRLIAVSGAYGAEGTEYRTELETFTRVVSMGDAEGGPTHFRAWARSGQILDFGTTEDARIEAVGRSVVRSWLLAKASDRRSNYLTFHYTEDAAGGDFQLAQVRYTGNETASVLPNERVELLYEDRPDVVTSYVAGSLTTVGKRLARIATFDGDVLVRDYRLGYDNDGVDGRTRLRTLTECGADNICLRPTRFSWQEGGTLQTTPTNWYGLGLNQGTMYADLNGDGATDILYQRLTGAYGYLYYALSSIDWRGTRRFDFQSYSNGYITGAVQMADLNGDGAADVLEARPEGVVNTYISFPENGFSQGYWTTSAVARLGSGFSGEAKRIRAADFDGDGRGDVFDLRADGSVNVTLVGGDISVAAANHPVTGLTATTTQWATGLEADPDNLVLADFDGDGRADVLQLVGGNGVVRLSRGNSFGPASSWTAMAGATIRELRTGDINGDGKTDLARIATGVSTWLSTGASFDDRLDIPFVTTDRDQLADMTGDGRADLVQVSEGYVRVARSLGRNFGPLELLTERLTTPVQQVTERVYTRLTNPSGYPFSATGDFEAGPGAVCTALGYEGTTGAYQCQDGNHPPCAGYVLGLCAPYFIYAQGGSWYQAHHTLNTFTHTKCFGGAVYQTIESVDCIRTDRNAPALTDAIGVHLADFDGDGLLDAIQGHVIPGATMGSPFVSLNRGRVADLVTGVTNGLGATTTLSYKPLTDVPPWEGMPLQTHAPRVSSYPTTAVRQPLYVVRTVDSPDGLGGSRRSTYAYEGGRSDRRGRGFLGYQAIVVRDEATGLWTRTTYRQDFPFTGATTGIERRRYTSATAYTVLNQSTSTLSDVTSFGGAVHLPVQTGSVERAWDLDGSAMPTIETAQSDFVWGNPRSIVVSQSHGGSTFRTSTTNDFLPADEPQWLLLRLSRATVVHEAPGVAPQTRTAAFTYGSDGLLTSEIREPDDAALRLETSYEHDAFGNRIRATQTPSDGSAPRFVATTYDPSGRFAIRSENALGHSVFHEIDGRFGTEIRGTDPNGLVATAQYDALGRKVLETRPDRVSTTLTTAFCDGSCPSGAVFVANAATTQAPSTRTYFDMLGREVRSESEGWGGRWVRVEKTYDALGRLTRTTRPQFTDDAAVPLSMMVSYDVLGRPLVETAADGSTTRHAYRGLQTETTDALGRTSSTLKDARGKSVRILDTVGNAVTFLYDAQGNVTQAADPVGGVVSTIHNVLGQRVDLTDPDTGHWTYRHNAYGEMVEQQSPSGDYVTMQYDTLGRLIERTEREGTTRWEFDTARNGVGLLAAEDVTGSGALATLRREVHYDEHTRPTTATLHFDGRSWVTTTIYDALGRVARTISPVGLRLDRQYDSRSVLTSITDGDDSTPYWTLLEVDADGQATQERLGNGLITTRSFDRATGRVSRISTPRLDGQSCVPAVCTPDASWDPLAQRDATGCAYVADNGRTERLPAECAGATPQSYEVGFDAVGNLTRRADLVTGLDETFSYDALHRLISVTGPSAITLGYNAAGGLTSRSDLGSILYDGGRPHAVGTVQTASGDQIRTYDANGNPLSDGTRTYDWTSFDRPSRVASATAWNEFLYDGQHDRIRRFAGDGAVTTYLGAAYEEVVTAAGETEQRHRISAGHGLAAEVVLTAAGKAVHYLLTDHLSSVSVATDGAGEVIERLSYDAFGARRLGSGLPPSAAIFGVCTTRGFTGHEMLDGLGLVHMNARLYDPLLGRFISPDTVIQFAGSTQGYDRYAYGGNNPLSYTDPTGHGFGKFFKSFFRAVLAIAVAIFLPELIAPMIAAVTGAAVSAVSTIVITGAIVGGISGFIASGDMRGALTGALGGGLFAGAGIIGNELGEVARFTAHAAAGAIMSGVQGTDLKSGLLASTFRYVGGTWVESLPDSSLLRTIAASVVGGIGSVLGGGKFENGALAGAFGEMFNHQSSKWASDGSSSVGVCRPGDAELYEMQARIDYQLNRTPEAAQWMPREPGLEGVYPELLLPLGRIGMGTRSLFNMGFARVNAFVDADIGVGHWAVSVRTFGGDMQTSHLTSSSFLSSGASIRESARSMAGFGDAGASVRVFSTNAADMIAFQRSVLGRAGDYHLQCNSCASHVADVLRSGGANAGHTTRDFARWFESRGGPRSVWSE